MLILRSKEYDILNSVQKSPRIKLYEREDNTMIKNNPYGKMMIFILILWIVITSIFVWDEFESSGLKIISPLIIYFFFAPFLVAAEILVFWIGELNHYRKSKEKERFTVSTILSAIVFILGVSFVFVIF